MWSLVSKICVWKLQRLAHSHVKKSVRVGVVELTSTRIRAGKIKYIDTSVWWNMVLLWGNIYQSSECVSAGLYYFRMASTQFISQHEWTSKLFWSHYIVIWARVHGSPCEKWAMGVHRNWIYICHTHTQKYLTRECVIWSSLNSSSSKQWSKNRER